MSNATDRIVVQVTPDEKQALVAKAERLNMPLSELMRRGASTYSPEDGGDDLAHFATEIHQAVLDIGESIEQTVLFCSQVNARIAAMESRAPEERRISIETDETLRLVRESNARIAAMEAAAPAGRERAIAGNETLRFIRESNERIAGLGAAIRREMSRAAPAVTGAPHGRS